MLRNAKYLLVVLALQVLSVFARGNSDGGDIDEALLFRREGDWLKFKVCTCVCGNCPNAALCMSADVQTASENTTHLSRVRMQVLVFGDLHYGEGNPLDPKSSAFQEHLLRLEAPVDLVVLNGIHVMCRMRV